MSFADICALLTLLVAVASYMQGKASRVEKGEQAQKAKENDRPPLLKVTINFFVVIKKGRK
jgi:hypothetical protein